MEYEYRMFWDIKVSEEIKHNHQNGTAFIEKTTIKEGIKTVELLPV